jgi:hypothetical protein
MKNFQRCTHAPELHGSMQTLHGSDQSLDVSYGIGAGSPADRALVDHHGIGDPLRAAFQDSRAGTGFAVIIAAFIAS